MIFFSYPENAGKKYSIFSWPSTVKNISKTSMTRNRKSLPRPMNDPKSQKPNVRLVNMLSKLVLALFVVDHGSRLSASELVDQPQIAQHQAPRKVFQEALNTSSLVQRHQPQSLPRASNKLKASIPPADRRLPAKPLSLRTLF